MSKLTLENFEPGERLDKTIAKLYPKYSRSAIEKLIESKKILVNKKHVKTKYTLKPNDIVLVDFNDLDREVESIDLTIIYEDNNVIVLNKPVGVLAHSKGAFSKEGTVASWLKAHVDVSARTQDDEESDFWSSNRAGIVHRLDRGTSGVMIVAKNKETATFLQKQFSTRNVKKTYVAVIKGSLPEESGVIDIPIERNPKKPATFRAGINGKSAQTAFSVLQSNQGYSLVELRPVTGRTHQLRVHLAYLKHPIVGDEFYDGEPADRLMLHAKELEITLPGGKRTIFSAPVPKNFKAFIA